VKDGDPNMVITILEAHVDPGQWTRLEQAYKEEVKALDPRIRQTFLLHGIGDPSVWRIATVWRSRQALEEMRKEGTPRGVVMFREAGAEPSLSIFDVAADAP
jgi:heme-degrading monooxygenase HmoA